MRIRWSAPLGAALVVIAAFAMQGAAAGAADGQSIRIAVPYVAFDAAPEPPPPPPPPEPPPVDPAFLALEDELAGIIGAWGVPGQFAIAVTDLQTGHSIDVRGDDWHLSGCTINLFALIQTVRDIEDGRLERSEMDATIAETIRSSNATTAVELYRTLGGGDIVAGLERTDGLIREELGLSRVFLDHPPAFGQYTRNLNPNNWVTALDLNAALAALYTGELLDPGNTAYLLERMAGVKPGLNYLTATGNDGTTSHKNGFFPYPGGFVDNDAAIVRFERGGTEYAYAVTFLSQDVPTQYGEVGMAQTMMSRIWEYFDARYR